MNVSKKEADTKQAIGVDRIKLQGRANINEDMILEVWIGRFH